MIRFLAVAVLLCLCGTVVKAQEIAPPVVVTKTMPQPIKPFGAPTAKMQAVGMSWTDITVFVEHLISLLESHGPMMINMVRNGLKMVQAITDRDLSEIIKLTMQFNVDIRALIAAIRAEFGLAVIGPTAVLPPVVRAGPPPIVVFRDPPPVVVAKVRIAPFRGILRVRPFRALFFRRGGC